MQIASTTRRGHRTAMQDCAIALKFDVPSPLDSQITILLVLDGVGGHAGGHRASQLGVTHFMNSLLKYLWSVEADAPENIVAEAVACAWSQLSEAFPAVARQNSDLRSMATTFTSAIIVDDWLHVAWVGDSRVYLCRDGHSHALTRDHSLVQQMIDAGQLSEDEAERHPQRSVITRSLNAWDPSELATNSFALRDGDLIWLASDGLFEGLTHAYVSNQLWQANHDGVTLQQRCNQMVDAAIAAGSQDNVSLACGHLEPASTQTAQDQDSRTLIAAYPDDLNPQCLAAAGINP